MLEDCGLENIRGDVPRACVIMGEFVTRMMRDHNFTHAGTAHDKMYWSQKEERELVYYRAADVASATLLVVDNSESARPWTFQVHIREVKGIEFAPGEFAAESEDMRQRWLEVFKSNGAKLVPGLGDGSHRWMKALTSTFRAYYGK